MNIIRRFGRWLLKKLADNASAPRTNGHMW